MHLSRVLLFLPLLVLPVACGDDDARGGDTTTPATSESATTESAPSESAPTTEPGGDRLGVTRPDGSSFTVGGPFTLDCVPSDQDADLTVVRASTPYFNDGPLGSSGAYVEIDPARIGTDGTTYDLPLSTGADEGDAAILFLYELEAPGRNELNADRDDSSGTLRVVTATCDPVPRLVVEVDATLGSELTDGDAVEVVGRLDLTGS